MPWRVKGKFFWIGEVGGFGKISFIALFYLYVNCGGRGIWCAKLKINFQELYAIANF